MIFIKLNIMVVVDFYALVRKNEARREMKLRNMNVRKISSKPVYSLEDLPNASPRLNEFMSARIQIKKKKNSM